MWKLPLNQVLRTFIPARLMDNPHLLATGYGATLQSMPEPLRSAPFHGRRSNLRRGGDVHSATFFRVEIRGPEGIRNRLTHFLILRGVNQWVERFRSARQAPPRSEREILTRCFTRTGCSLSFELNLMRTERQSSEMATVDIIVTR